MRDGLARVTIMLFFLFLNRCAGLGLLSGPFLYHHLRPPLLELGQLCQVGFEILAQLGDPGLLLCNDREQTVAGLLWELAVGGRRDHSEVAAEGLDIPALDQCYRLLDSLLLVRMTSERNSREGQ